jgi:hypothetical protein
VSVPPRQPPLPPPGSPDQCQWLQVGRTRYKLAVAHAGQGLDSDFAGHSCKMASRREGAFSEPTASSSLPPRSHRSTPSIASSSRRPPASTRTVTDAPAQGPTQHTTLTKRLLFPHLLPDAPIPRLFASPDVTLALESELYDFIALALRAFVNPWWTKLTRYDKEFLPHITYILAHVLRTAEERIRAADFSPLVFRDVPLILNQHYHDYRAAAAKTGSAYAAGGAASLASLFHAQQQHIGVTQEGRLDEVYIRTAIDAVLKALLPEEDWAPETERHIVREVIVMVICKSVAPKLTQGWFIQKLALDLMGRKEAVATSVSRHLGWKPEPQFMSVQLQYICHLHMHTFTLIHLILGS